MLFFKPYLAHAYYKKTKAEKWKKIHLQAYSWDKKHCGISFNTICQDSVG